MKKAEEYLTYWSHLYDMTLNYDKRGKDAILGAIRQAQEDAIREAIQRCETLSMLKYYCGETAHMDIESMKILEDALIKQL